MTDAPEFPTNESTETANPAPVIDPFAVRTADAPVVEAAPAVAEPETAAEAAVVDELVADEPIAEQPAATEAPLDEAAAPVAEAEAAEADTADDDEADPADELRESLRAKPGEWYVIHSYAGYENRVKSNVESRTTSLNMEDYIFQVEVPTEDVVEIKNNQRKNVKRQKFPGYVLVRMDLTDGSWSAVRNTPGVTGFVGHGHQPTPLTLDEVVTILAPKPEKKTGAAGSTQTEIRVLDFEVGDSVTIMGEHAFAGLLATIHEVNPDSRRVKAFVEIFGRETPVELEFSNIQKN